MTSASLAAHLKWIEVQGTKWTMVTMTERAVTPNISLTQEGFEYFHTLGITHSLFSLPLAHAS